MAGCAYPGFSPSQNRSNTRQKMTWHVGFPLLSFGLEHPKRISTFTATELKGKGQIPQLPLLCCQHMIGYNPFSASFLRLHPSFDIFTLLFASIFRRRWGSNLVLPARTPTTFGARFSLRHTGTRHSRLTSDALRRMSTSTPPGCRRYS